jgi:hypothetical protein
VDEVCGGVDGAGGSDDEHQRGAVNLLLDAIHLERNFTEENDVGAEARAAGAARDFIEGAIDGVIFNGWTATFGLAAGLGEFAVHVDEVAGAGALVEIIYILGAEEEAVTKVGFELGQGEMGGVGLSLVGGGAASGVELPDEGWVAMQGFGGADVLDAVARPEAI